VLRLAELELSSHTTSSKRIWGCVKVKHEARGSNENLAAFEYEVIVAADIR